MGDCPPPRPLSATCPGVEQLFCLLPVNRLRSNQREFLAGRPNDVFVFPVDFLTEAIDLPDWLSAIQPDGNAILHCALQTFKQPTVEMPQNQQSIGLYWFTREHEKSTQLRFRRDLGHSGIRLDKVFSNVDASPIRCRRLSSGPAPKTDGRFFTSIGVGGLMPRSIARSCPWASPWAGGGWGGGN
jgi:hypothetical protein